MKQSHYPLSVSEINAKTFCILFLSSSIKEPLKWIKGVEGWEVMMPVNSRDEEIKIAVIGESTFPESVPRSRSSGKEAV